MRLWLRWIVAFALLTMAGIGAWCHANRLALECRWRAYRVGASESFDDARTEIAWFECDPDRQAKLRELVEKWGTGNPRFDLCLARHVASAESTEALREAFSLEFGWRGELLARWAHYWIWQAPQEPDRQIADVLSYLDLIAASTPPKPLTWREVLDLQAIFALAEKPGLARRLKPEGWHERYRQWREAMPATMPHVPRPDRPFPDWKGAGPN